MAPRIFISFAKEDLKYRTFLASQAKNAGTPFNFVDMSLQQPFDSRWKTRCRERIASCDGFISLLSKKTWSAEGARWEMKCADEEGLPVIGIHIHSDRKGAVPPELIGRRIIEWRWASIARFIEQVDSKRSFVDKLFDF